MRELQRILIVEDDEGVGRTLVRVARTMRVGGPPSEVAWAMTLADGMRKLSEGFDLILLDVRLPDGSGVRLAEVAASMAPAPLVIAISGSALAEEAFRLAQAGVAEFVKKPFDLLDLERAFLRARTGPARLEPYLKAQVGWADMRQVQADVRRTMLEQALALSHGNRTHAARMLHVTRQAVQNLLRGPDREADEPGSAEPRDGGVPDGEAEGRHAPALDAEPTPRERHDGEPSGSSPTAAGDEGKRRFRE